ncbi:unnamed protein product [Mycena citricolor]|uniref:Uncharacterized protein n=1 Tax=Mycena citricolor TaxID=2018698 RepID=A0AAD2HBK6_9AGAR|nr:unnamed protein product [Mycena citricolor]
MSPRSQCSLLSLSGSAFSASACLVSLWLFSAALLLSLHSSLIKQLL